MDVLTAFKKIAIPLLFVTGLVGVNEFSMAQPSMGQITGMVVDAQTGESVIGANVAITGTTQGSATDLDGKYAIRNLNPGVYSITVTYISYSRKVITGVKVSRGESQTLAIALQPKTVGMDEITVTASADRSSAAGLLAMQRKSVPIQDGLSSQQISKLGDSDVGTALLSTSLFKQGHRPLPAE